MEGRKIFEMFKIMNILNILTNPFGLDNMKVDKSLFWCRNTGFFEA